MRESSSNEGKQTGEEEGLVFGDKDLEGSILQMVLSLHKLILLLLFFFFFCCILFKNTSGLNLFPEVIYAKLAFQ